MTVSQNWEAEDKSAAASDAAAAPETAPDAAPDAATDAAPEDPATGEPAEMPDKKSDDERSESVR